MSETKAATGVYKVMVDDNFHYMDESERTSGGTFATLADAIAACRKIVDDDLAGLAKPGMSAEEIYKSYISFGADPFVLGDMPGVPFSAWEYARERSYALAGEKRSDS